MVDLGSANGKLEQIQNRKARTLHHDKGQSQMNLEMHSSRIKTIKQDHPGFHINDGFISAPRAGFEVNSHCPAQYKQVIVECINNGWLKPVAYMHEREVLISGLAK